MTKMKRGRTNLSKRERRFVNIEEVSLIASRAVADGKNLPVLILDTSVREDIKLAIENHEVTGTGDVKANWARARKSDYDNIQIIFQLLRPSNCKFIVNFVVEKRGAAVDMIVQNGGCYIQSSDYGKKISENPNAPKILIEVMSDDFKDDWEKIYHIGITNMFKRKKVKPREASEMAELFIKEMRIMNYSIGRQS